MSKKSKPDIWKHSELTGLRGWRRDAIATYLGDPDITGGTGRTQVKLYRLARIVAVEIAHVDWLAPVKATNAASADEIRRYVHEDTTLWPLRDRVILGIRDTARELSWTRRAWNAAKRGPSDDFEIEVKGLDSIEDMDSPNYRMQRRVLGWIHAQRSQGAGMDAVCHALAP